MLLSPAKAKDFVNAGRSRKRLSGIAAGALRRGILRIFSRIESAASGTGYVTGTFDGLKKILSGSDTEYTSEVDISTSALMDSNYNAYLDELDGFISKLAEKPDILLMNNELLTKTRAAARRAGFYERSVDGFGRTVEKYNGIPMMDVGQYYNGTKTIDVIETTTPSATAYGETAIYAVKLGLNAFHGISVDGSKMVHTYLPDLNAPGAVKKGEVEMLAGAVLKNSKMAGVLKGIKVKPKTAG